MNNGKVLSLVIVVFLSLGTCYAQADLDAVHLFQNFFRDATIAENPYGQGALHYSTYDYGSSFFLGAQGGYPINPMLEANAEIGFMSYSPDEGDGQSGLTDMYVGARYKLGTGKTKFAAGGFITLPIGDEKLLGQEKFNFGAFGAVRHPLANGMVITGTLGLDFIETTKFTGGGLSGDILNPTYEEPKEETEYENSLVLGGGVLYPFNATMVGVGELVIKTEVEYMMLSAGVDYTLDMGGKLRGALGLGLDDGAPDFQIMVNFLYFLSQ